MDERRFKESVWWQPLYSGTTVMPRFMDWLEQEFPAPWRVITIVDRPSTNGRMLDERIVFAQREG